MIKDKTILDLIDKLKLKINFNEIEIVDHWDADLCAIGLKKGNRLIYISSYDFWNGKINGYDFDLELLHETQTDKLNVVKEARNVTEEILIEELKVFLGV